ncbi:MAG: hypothetical protein C0392_13265 [Syntrophus sp. (in: bacteria)]|nr:hypothetical protein [Syntrophus sp. (in: bacteria)]
MYIPSHIMKPARYAGIEPNRVMKDPHKARVRFALCYPDIYEVGMSYFGLFLLYELMNNQEDVWCERCFAPWDDMENYLRQNNLLLATLESKTPLHAMDGVGFSLSYELNVTNVLNMLALAGIPLRAEDRERGPIIIGGGPLMLNPKPFERFFDIIVTGEGDTVIVEILNILKELKGTERAQIIKEIGKLEGVYSPLFPKERVKRLFIENLDGAYHPIRPPIPIVGAIHNRLNIEISRGCGNGCRFCLAGFGYRPYRERSFECVAEIIDRAIQETGYEEISLLSLSSGDYSGLFQTISYIKDHHKGVSVALPSLKIGSIGEEEIRVIGDIARTGFTFALESASPEIRCQINKNIDVGALVDQLPTLKKYGWRKLKLYFMIGFPWEKEEDIMVIRDLVTPFAKEGITINLAVSPFIPKPHTPFQRLAMEDEDQLSEKMRMIKGALKKKNVSVKYRDIRTSAIEAIISRGDEYLTPLFEHLHARGAKLEAWREFFRPELYEEWFQKESFDTKRYLGAISPDGLLPWSFIDMGVGEPFLKNEYEKAVAGLMTPDCYTGCAHCGMECPKKERRAESGEHRAISVKTNAPNSLSNGSPLNTQHSTLNTFTYKYTFRYGKYGDARYIGHIDTMNIIVRALRSAGVSIKMHGKYHPMPNISLSDALPMGVESTCELIEVESLDVISLNGMIVGRMNRILPKGMRVFECNAGGLKGRTGEYAFLLISEKAVEWADMEGLKRACKGNRHFYIYRERKGLKEIWKSGLFHRIVKMEAKKINGIRTDN